MPKRQRSRMSVEEMVEVGKGGKRPAASASKKAPRERIHGLGSGMRVLIERRKRAIEAQTTDSNN